MAYIRKRTLANGKNAYLVCWTGPDGKPDSEQFSGGDCYERAKAKKADVEHELRAGSYVDARAGRERFKDYATRWLDNQICRPSSQRVYEMNLRLHVYPTFGSRAVSNIKRSDVLALVKKLDGPLAPTTVANIMALVASIFTAAVFDRMIASSPCERIKLPKPTTTEIVIPTVEQVQAIAGDALLPPDVRGMVLPAASTGLRLGELMGVTLESLNFFAREVTVRPDLGQLIRVPGAGMQLAPPKTEASARTVPLGSVAVTAFAEHLRVRPANADDGCGGFVFQSPFKRGGPLSRAYVHSHLSAALARQGFPPGTGLHLFRHFYASGLIAANTNAKVVQARLGHATISETYDTYGHLWPNDDDTSRQAIDAAFNWASRDLTKISLDASTRRHPLG